jgi:hypothetical protein
MKLSIFTTASWPKERGDNPKPAIQSYLDLADETVIIDGATGYSTGLFYKAYREDSEKKHQLLLYQWPREFSWEFIGQQFQQGYEAATGDWVIHADLDFIFHERDFDSIRQACQKYNNAPALSFWKYQFILPDRYNLKSRLVIAVNKGRFGSRIRFDSGGDLCQPSLDGKELTPNLVPEARVAFYNYEKPIKTIDQVTEDVERMDRAYQRHFGRPLYSNDERSAFEGWMKMAIGRLTKPQKKIALAEHPKYIQKTIGNLKPSQFGYDNFGRSEVSDYAKSRNSR